MDRYLIIITTTTTTMAEKSQDDDADIDREGWTVGWRNRGSRGRCLTDVVST